MTNARAGIPQSRTHGILVLALLAALLVLPLVPAPALAASWGLDTSFSDDGELTTDFGSSSDEALSLAIDSKGRIVLAGDSYSASSGYDAFALARYKPNGSLDKNFGGGGTVTTQIGGFSIATSVAIDAKGRIVVGGSSAPVPGADTDFALARYKPDGSLDRSFDGDGTLTTDFGSSEAVAYSLAIDAERRIVVGGASWNGAGYSPFALARYNPDGSLDTSFDGDGKLTTQIGGSSYANSVALDPHGRIVAGGSSTTDYREEFALARYNPDGSLDTSFSGDGKLTTQIGSSREVVYSLAIDAEGGIVAGGFSTSVHGDIFALARYKPDGSLDTSFTGDGTLTTPIGSGGSDYANSVAIDAEGRIVAGGSSFILPSAHGEFAVARYNPDGSLDTSFSDDGKLTTQIATDAGATSLALDPQGRIVLGGSSYSGGNNDFALARYRADVAGKATAAKTQKQHGNAIVVKVKVTADETLTATASGKVKVNPSYKLRPKKAELTAGEASTLKLKPKEAQARQIAAALKRGESATAKLEVELTDEAGDSEVEKLSVKLKR